MNSNKSYLKFADGVAVFGPVPLVWSKHHVETYPEEVVNEETGEVSQTGNMLTSEWDEGPRRLAHPTAEQYADMGYLPVSDRVPSETPGDGKEWKAKGSGIAEDDWELVDGDSPYWKRVYEEVDIADPVNAPRVFSKLKIYAAISALGAWDAVKAWLEEKTINGMNGWMAFSLAQDIGESNELFVPLASEVRVLLGLSEEQFEATLAQCVLEA